MDKTVTLMAVGDIMLSENRGTGKMIKEHGPEFLFEKISKLLQPADILFGNLENTISANGSSLPGNDPHITFRATPNSIKGLTLCNFDVVSLANNHITDYGEAALIDTFNILGENGIVYVGAGRNLTEAVKEVVFERNGIKIAFLAYCSFISFATKPALRSRSGMAQSNIRNIKKKIREVYKKADVVVVSIHWGVDFTDYPLSFQMKDAREMIDCGAHLILGHHPHYLQGIEKYKNGIIVYSLGDFIFDEPGRDTFIFKCDISGNGIKKPELIPAKISKHFQTEPVDEVESSRIHKKIEHLSRAYENYDTVIANKIIDKFIAINLYIFKESGNIYILKNFNSLFMLKKLLSFLVRKAGKKLKNFFMYLS